MGALLQDVRYSIRTLLKSPSFTMIAVLTLGLGVGANTALFSVVKAVLLNSLPYRQPDRIVTLAEGDARTSNPITLSYGQVEDWKTRTHAFQSIAEYEGWSPALTGAEVPQMLHGLQVTWNFFDVLGVRPRLGRGFLPEEDRPNRWHVVLLSYPYWIQHFGGNPDVIGQTVTLDQTAFQIVGVLPESFQPLSFSMWTHAPDIWAPLGYDLSVPDACRTCQHLRGVARLSEGVTIGQARAEMNSVAEHLTREFPKEYPADARVDIRTLRESWYGRVQTALWLLLGATAFVLLIACANVANLLLARAAQKRREVAVRSALGASPLGIARQLLTESTLVSLIGGAAGVLLAVWGTTLLVKAAPAEIPRLNDVHIDAAVLMFTLLISTGTGIVMGLVPAVEASRVDHREAMQQSSRGVLGGSRSIVRSLLVSSEVCLAFVLTVASGLLLRSFVRVLSVSPGFNAQNLYAVEFALIGPKYDDDKATVRTETEAIARIRTIPGVEASGIVSTLPAGGNFDQCGFVIQDRRMPDPEVPDVDRYIVSPGYFQAMGIPLLRGRLFTEADVAGAKQVAIISDMTARQIFPGEEPLGRQIQLGGRKDGKPWATIVGIVGDVHQYGLDSPATPQAYELYSNDPNSYTTLTVRSSVGMAALTRAIENQIWAVDKNTPVLHPLLMTQILWDSLAQRRFTMSLLAGFGVLALLLAAIGIYGVMSYTVAQRTNEIGIRVALGAQSRDILNLVSRQGMLRAGIGLLVGLIVSLALTRVLASQLFAVSAVDPVTFGVVLLLLAGVALFACYLPARRATRLDPLVALRHE
jgi:putative ABC transport system permease protein